MLAFQLAQLSLSMQHLIAVQITYRKSKLCEARHVVVRGRPLDSLMCCTSAPFTPRCARSFPIGLVTDQCSEMSRSCQTRLNASLNPDLAAAQRLPWALIL
jgi:hypothetical protein